MPYVIRNGLAYWEDDFPTEDTEAPEATPRTGLTVPEGQIGVIDGDQVRLACSECGKEYKTERGLENHLTTH